MHSFTTSKTSLMKQVFVPNSKSGTGRQDCSAAPNSGASYNGLIQGDLVSHEGEASERGLPCIYTHKYQSRRVYATVVLKDWQSLMNIFSVGVLLYWWVAEHWRRQLSEKKTSKSRAGNTQRTTEYAKNKTAREDRKHEKGWSKRESSTTIVIAPPK